ncbi:hypothetical protein LCGC14_1449100 [marine sediment metagenome]|uniref:Uncharacterized protein n=1 Tax=marine sediment metagenome TaxID=412755 RepID=A0A0F9MKA7_9ZZZZ
MPRKSTDLKLRAEVREHLRLRDLFREYERTRALFCANPHEDAYVASEQHVLEAAIEWATRSTRMVKK